MNLRKRKGGDIVNPTEFKIAQIRAGVSKEEIAKELGINITTLYRKINGESDFTLSELKQLKRMLGMTKDDVDCIFFSESLTETQEEQLN